MRWVTPMVALGVLAVVFGSPLVKVLGVVCVALSLGFYWSLSRR